MGPVVGRLHVIVNPTPVEPALDLAARVLDAGAPLLQVRVKDADDATVLRLAQPIVSLCVEHGAVAVVNDRADVCVAAGAHGVHGGAGDLPTSALRVVVGTDRLVGGTARTPDAARRAQEAGADYVGVGPVYATTSKTGLPEPIGPDMIRRVSGAVDIPVIAIAGITVERVPELLAAGAHGVAVIGAIAGADDPGRETRRFLTAIEATCGSAR